MSPAKPSFQTIAIVSLAMHFSILLITAITFFLGSTMNWELTLKIKPELQIVCFILSTLAIINALLSILIPTLFKRESNFETKSTNNFYQNEVCDNTAKKSLFLYYLNLDQKTFSLTIIRFALAESVVLMGFVLSFLNQSTLAIIPFAFIALSLQIVFSPLLAKVIKR